mgnify:CR=1 FL=1
MLVFGDGRRFRLPTPFGGDEEDRTPDPLLARQVLSQLSYTPKGDFYSLMESPALRASSFKIEQYRFKNL